MAKGSKLLEKARNNPRGWRFDELRRLLESFGFEIRSGKGSHHVASHPKVQQRPVIPSHAGELPPVYVRKVVDAIDELLRHEAEEEAQNDSQ